MKRKPKKKIEVAIVGSGSLGRVLSLALHATGYSVTEIVSREGYKSRSKSNGIALAVGARPVTLKSASFDAEVIWLCISDHALSTTAKKMAWLRKDWKGKTVLHSSGALPASELAPLRRRGAAIASAHPMNTFVANSKPSFAGTPFAVEGDDAAVRVARQIARKLNAGATVFKIAGREKPLYHAVGSLSSPLLVSLLSAAEQVAKSAGILRPRELTGRILQQTLDNYSAHGADAAFSGPIRRGDVATVSSHLSALRKMPAAREVYVALAKNAVANLPVKRQAELKKILSS